MSKRIFITATNTDIGKTYTTKLLLKKFASLGYRVGVIKPIETGVIDGFMPDGEELLNVVSKLNSEFKNISTKDIVPFTYELATAPIIASNNTPLDFEKIDSCIQRIEKLCDILLIEGAGGLLVPLDEDTMMVDLIQHLEASALLVTHCSLGCINDTLLSKGVLEQRAISHVVAFNCREKDDGFGVISQPYFDKVDFKVLKVNENIDTICDLLYNL